MVHRFAALWFWGMQFADCLTPCNGGLKVAGGCGWWRLQMGRRRAMARWQWVADSGTVVLGNAVAVARRRVMVGSRWQWVAIADG